MCTPGVALGGFLYAVGGQDAESSGTPSLASVERYDIVSGQWSAVASMATARTWSAAVALGGHVYAIGGYNGGYSNADLDSVERYDPDSDSWSFMQHLSVTRSRPGAVALGGFIYAIGGHSGFQTSVERYDPGTNTWTAVASMNKGRAGMGTALLDSKIFVAGGHWGDDGFFTSEAVAYTAETYDPSTDSWTLLSSLMTEKRNLFALAAFNGYLYAFGFEYVPTGECVDSIEKYDPQADAWAVLNGVTHSNGAHCQAAAVVI